MNTFPIIAIIVLILVAIFSGLMSTDAYEEGEIKIARGLIALAVCSSILAFCIFIIPTNSKEITVNTQQIDNYNKTVNSDKERTLEFTGPNFGGTLNLSDVEIDPNLSEDKKMYLIEKKDVVDDDRWWLIRYVEGDTHYILTNNPEDK